VDDRESFVIDGEIAAVNGDASAVDCAGRVDVSDTGKGHGRNGT
jgi:hypothetical protein